MPQFANQPFFALAQRRIFAWAQAGRQNRRNWVLAPVLLAGSFLLILTANLAGTAATAGDYHFQRALQYQFAGNVQAAIEEYRRGLQGAPDSADGHTRLGTLLLDEQGDVDAAISEFVTALSIDAENRFCQSRLDEAISRKNAGAKENVARGNDFYRSGQMSRAAAAYRLATMAGPTDPEARNCLAWTLYRMGKLDEALHEVNMALKLKPEDAEYINTLACIQFDKGDADAAVASYKKAIARSKTANPADLYGLAISFLAKGDQASALKNFQEAIKSDPNYINATYIRDKIGMSIHALAAHDKLLSLSEHK